MIVEDGLEVVLEENGGWDARIRVVRCGDLVRSYLVKSERFVLVYDTLLGPLSGTFLREQALDFAQGRPLIVVNSHADWDHYFGNMCFPEPILGHHRMLKRLQAGAGDKELRQKRGEHESFAAVSLSPPSIAIGDGTVLHGGDLSFRLLHTRGHRPGHLAVHIPELSTLLPGDCVEDPIPLVDEDSDESSRTLRQLISSLKLFIDLKPTWVLANHASPEAALTRVRANLEYLLNLKNIASTSQSLEQAQELSPVENSWPEFYQRAHSNQVRMAWQQFGRSSNAWDED